VIKLHEFTARGMRDGSGAERVRFQASSAPASQGWTFYDEPMSARRFKPPWPVDHSPSTRRRMLLMRTGVVEVLKY
jgi:hypothetical protein